MCENYIIYLCWGFLLEHYIIISSKNDDMRDTVSHNSKDGLSFPDNGVMDDSGP